MTIAFASIPPSSAASSTTPARSSRLNSCSKPKTKRPPGALRLGRRRRALRRPGVALHGPAGAGDRLLHRRVAAAGGARRCIGKLDAKARARPGAGHGVRPRRTCRLPGAASRRCAMPASAPSFISAIPSTASASRSNTPTSAAAPCAVIQGRDEKAKGEVQIKDLIAGARAERHQGPRRIPEEAGRGAVRGQGNRAGRGSAQAAGAARHSVKPLIPAHAGIQGQNRKPSHTALGPRLRGGERIIGTRSTGSSVSASAPPASAFADRGCSRSCRCP